MTLTHGSSDRHKSKPIFIQNRRWDPVSAASSASISTASDMADAAVGVFLKPYEEYKHGRLDKKPSRTTNPEYATSHPLWRLKVTLSFSLPAGDSKISKPPMSKAEIFHASGAKRSDLNRAGAMAAASATSFGKLFVALSKGGLVDIPVATADGMRAVPQFCNHEVKDYCQVTGWKSGAVVAGKTFGHGMYEGLTDIFIQTYQGKKQEGAAGVAKGPGKGLISMTMKTTAGVVGLVAYPTQGVCKSIRNAVKSTTRRQIAEAKWVEGRWLAGTDAGSHMDHALLIAEFEARGRRFETQ